ncbi:MAG: hypothetical protein JNM94_05660 [Phycisphaerae bacterium]|nr:hypothetical protein [Phycisphaerae bacterium]
MLIVHSLTGAIALAGIGSTATVSNAPVTGDGTPDIEVSVDPHGDALLHITVPAGGMAAYRLRAKR